MALDQSLRVKQQTLMVPENILERNLHFLKVLNSWAYANVSVHKVQSLFREICDDYSTYRSSHLYNFCNLNV